MKELSIQEKASRYDEAIKRGKQIQNTPYTAHWDIMKEAGYEWEVAWSEEDKRKINRIHSILGQAADTHAYSTTCRLIGDKECIELQDFIKSLKERVQPQNFTITDEELIKARNEAYNDALDKLEYHSDTPTFNDGWYAAIWYLKKRMHNLGLFGNRVTSR